MSDPFFPPVPPRPDEDDGPPTRFRRPSWARPVGTIPGVVPLELVLAHAGGTTLAIPALHVYPAGLAFELWALRDDAVAGPADPREPFPDGRPELGVELPDGRRLREADGLDEEQPRAPDRAVLFSGGGSSSDGSMRISYWLWPFPRAGRWSIVVRWPRVGIGETRTTLDAAPLVDAAERAQVLFTDEHLPERGEDAGWLGYEPLG